MITEIQRNIEWVVEMFANINYSLVVSSRDILSYDLLFTFLFFPSSCLM